MKQFLYISAILIEYLHGLLCHYTNTRTGIRVAHVWIKDPEL
jgi:hypothetical protein